MPTSNSPNPRFGAVDMSPEAVSARLKQWSDLLKMCWYLKQVGADNGLHPHTFEREVQEILDQHHKLTGIRLIYRDGKLFNSDGTPRSTNSAT